MGSGLFGLGLSELEVLGFWGLRRLDLFAHSGAIEKGFLSVGFLDSGLLS